MIKVLSKKTSLDCLSPVQVTLRKAEMSVFPQASPRIYPVSVGASLRIPCSGYPLSYPESSLYWATRRTGFDPQPILYNSRITQDQDGAMLMLNMS